MISPTRQPVPTPPAPAGWTRQELAELDDRELLGIAGSLPRFSQRRMAACELLVGRYRYLVWSCVLRYNRGPEPAEDLMQVGYVGLVAAINNFDPAVGCSLATYARSHINGEIKRYFRDKRWQVHVVRSVKELAMQARRRPGSWPRSSGARRPSPTWPPPWGSAAMICGMPSWLRWRFSRPRWMLRCPASPV